MGEQGVEDGAKDASLWSTEVMFPILTDWSQSQMLGCRPSVDSLYGFDCVEGGALIHKEPPDVGVLIFQVEEGIVENSSD